MLVDANIIRFDSFAAIEDIIANASVFGITNTTDRCYTGDDTGFTGGGTVCSDPNQYFFFDGIHPTAVAHGLIGQRMLAAVLAANEPHSIAILFLALAVAWLAMRGSQQRNIALHYGRSSPLP
jgi:phospholipase/lecithinase/hemolysin